MDINRAKAVCLVSAQLIETAKVEVQFIKATGNRDTSAFLEEKAEPQRPQLTAVAGKVVR